MKFPFTVQYPSFLQTFQWPYRTEKMLGILAPLAISVVLIGIERTIKRIFATKYFKILQSSAMLIVITCFVILTGQTIHNPTSSIIGKDAPPLDKAKITTTEYAPTKIAECERSISSIKNPDYPMMSDIVGSAQIISTEIKHCMEKRGGNIPLVLQGDWSISDYKRTGSHTSMQVPETSKDKIVELGQFYYPGYKAYGTVDGKQVHFATSASASGLVQITIPHEYAGTVNSYFGMSTATVIGCSLSVLSAVIIAVLYVRQFRERQRARLNRTK
ncbi:MAG: hypothetical protein LBI63_05470 [Candidatus Ancillula sp.]|nr:hypothetical protein [Candidatus Ancillula sp.]